MITGSEVLAAAHEAGFDFFTGVPCSLLTPVLNAVLTERQCRELGSDQPPAYVGATSEGEAIGLAAGAWLAGRHPVVLAQNSGFGNMVNPISSLLAPMRIPVLAIITWRGEPGRGDEPQHELMGRVTFPLCTLLNLSAAPFPDSRGTLALALRSALIRADATGQSSALVLREGVVHPEQVLSPLPRMRAAGTIHRDLRGGPYPSRAECIGIMADAAPPGAVLIATTGKCARELFTIADSPRNLYVIGSMGCASAVGAGVALHTRRPVIVLDGDGAALMKLGNLATIGATGPENLVHVLLDNAVHDSTGGQPTAAASADLAGVAHACGYRRVTSVDTVGGLSEAFDATAGVAGPHFLHVRISKGSLPDLGRPRERPDITARRFQAFLRQPIVADQLV